MAPMPMAVTPSADKVSRHNSRNSIERKTLIYKQTSNFLRTMKKIFYSLFALASLLTWTGCSSDSTLSPVDPNPEVQPVTYHFVATIQSGGTQLSPAIERQLADNGTILAATWEVGDKLKLFYTDNNSAAQEVTATVTETSGSSATIEAELTGTLSSDRVVTFVYPASAADGSTTSKVKADLLTSATQDGLLTGSETSIAKKYDVRTGTGTIVVDGEEAYLSGVAMLQSQISVLKFNITYNGVATAVASLTMTDKATEEVYTVAPASETSTIYIALNPTVQGRRFDVVAKNGQDTYTKTLTLHSALEAQKYYRSTLAYVTADHQSGPDANYDYVDLGITLKGKKILWATKNVGADSETDWGDYFAFGATEPWYSVRPTANGTLTLKSDKSEGYVLAKAPYYDTDNSAYTKYTTLGGVLDASDDAAHVNMGGDWYMPTDEEWKALKNNCTWDWQAAGNSTFGGVAGWKVTSKVDSSKFIFLPAAGCCDGTSLSYGGSYGLYWSATVSSSNSNYGCYLYFEPSYVYPDHNSRCFGYPVRGVIRQ